MNTIDYMLTSRAANFSGVNPETVRKWAGSAG